MRIGVVSEFRQLSSFNRQHRLVGLLYKRFRPFNFGLYFSHHPLNVIVFGFYFFFLSEYHRLHKLAGFLLLLEYGHYREQFLCLLFDNRLNISDLLFDCLEHLGYLMDFEYTSVENVLLEFGLFNQ
jgi:hypothetical protein